jgi:hypothetical protein
MESEPTQSGYDLSVQINVERKEDTYDVRCHGANGTMTMGPYPLLSVALDRVAEWASRQADWNRANAR